jgi:UDPglucose 6-dehydrogenase
METLIFGEGLERALKPERYVVGLSDESKALNLNYEEFLKQSNCPILKMSFESAELTKLSANFFLASTITTTNTLAALSSKLGANWNQIAESLRMDRRIGPFAYLNAGLGIGGTNIIRDLIGIRDMANTTGTESSIIDSMLINSEFSKNWLSSQLIEVLQLIETPKIGILGLSYKQNTDSTIGSSGIKTAKIFSKSYPIYVYDPVIKKNSELEDLVFWAESAKEVIFGVDILVIAAAWPEFKSEEFRMSVKDSNIKYLIDPFGCQPADKREKYEYRTLGLPPKKGKL